MCVKCRLLVGREIERWGKRNRERETVSGERDRETERDRERQ